MLTNLLVTASDAERLINPIIKLINVFLPSLLTLVGTIGMVYCVVLGIKYAKADDPQEHEKAKKGLINAIIGYLIIFILLIALNIFMPIGEEWLSEYMQLG